MRYAITNLTEAEAGSAAASAEQRRRHWLAALRRWSATGVTFVQLREKALTAAEQLSLLSAGMELLYGCEQAPRPRLLVNGRPDLALASGADGVHLTARDGELEAGQVRELFARAGRSECTVSVSCHTLEEVRAAKRQGVDLILFGPVFGKRLSPELTLAGTGLQQLGRAAEIASPVPLLALGGVAEADLPACRAVGAAGIAGIRLFA